MKNVITKHPFITFFLVLSIVLVIVSILSITKVIHISDSATTILLGSGVFILLIVGAVIQSNMKQHNSKKM